MASFFSAVFVLSLLLTLFHIGFCGPQIISSFVQGVIDGATRGQSATIAPPSLDMPVYGSLFSSRDQISTTPWPAIEIPIFGSLISTGRVAPQQPPQSLDIPFFGAIFTTTPRTTTVRTTTGSPSILGSIIGGVGTIFNGFFGINDGNNNNNLVPQQSAQQFQRPARSRSRTSEVDSGGPPCHSKIAGVSGRCVLFQECRVLHEVFKHIPFPAFMAKYGNCGRDGNGNVRICCPPV